MRACRPVLASALFLWAAAASAAPLVQNGEFAAAPEGWQTDHAAYRFVDDDGFRAPGCIRFTGPAPERSDGPWQAIPVRPHTEYVLAAALKSDGTLKPSVRVCREADRQVVAAAEAPQARPDTWTYVLVRFNSGPEERLLVVLTAATEAAPEGARACFDDVAVLLPGEVPAGQPVQGGFVARPPGENLARGCPVTFSATPNYPYSTDPDDPKQLTDGEYSAGYFWVQKSTVGWSHTSPVLITIDLGQVQPIAGVSYNTAAGVAGGGWPTAIFIATSDDGETWHLAGDLAILAAKNGLPPADRYSVYRYVTGELQTRGRYLRLGIVPQGGYTFCDEIEVYRGQEELLAREPAGEIVTDLTARGEREPTRSGIFWRLTTDLAATRAAVENATLPEARREALRARLAAIEKAIPDLPAPDPTTFKTVFPLNDLHARLLAVHASLLRARGLPAFFVWKKNRYDFLTPHEAPAKAPPPPTLSVEMMRGEVRAEAFLLTNASPRPVTAVVKLQGLPGAPRPKWLQVAAVPWTDTSHRVPVAAALPPAAYREGGFVVPVPAGVTGKVWLTIDSAGFKPGRYQGALVVTGVGRPIRLPFRLRVSPVQMSRPRLSLGMWDYTDGRGNYGITPQNRDAAIALMRSHGVDTPWAGSGVLPWPQAEAFDERHQLKAPLAFPASFAEWIRRWPDARQYFVFAAVGRGFAGATIGTPEFHGRVGSWAKALAQQMRDLGLKPQQLGILLVDEPHQDEHDEIVAAWARAIKAAAPEITLFQDPVWPRPDQTRIQEAITLCDVICPNLPIYYEGGEPVARYFAARRAAGQRLWFYQCSGPARLFDPYRYHRLQAWHCFRHGAVGMGFWAFGDTGGGKSSWNEYATAGTPFTPVFLSPDGVTDGIHWQAVREGIQDYEYLAMLRDAASRPANARLRAQAEALLAEAPAAVIGDYRSSYDWKQESDRTQADRYRLRVLALLEKMR
ncbi:MAG: discoidin domain-containing protein [Armatimonadetes bacterium]|nr:discoidin domain-containing protein [Armatimonadota bacterium]